MILARVAEERLRCARRSLAWIPGSSTQPSGRSCTTRPRAQLYTFNLRQPIPAIPIPLLPQDVEPELDLGAVLHALYDRARFDLRLDYSKPPVPPLDSQDAEWAAILLRSSGSH